MSLLRPNVERMEGYVPGEQPAAGTKVIKLNTNENPYPPSPRVHEAIVQELSNGGERLRLYSDPNATELRKAASELTAVPMDGIMAGNGSDELLALICRAALGSGDVVAYPYPTYVLYETLAAAQDARVTSVPFPRDFALPRELFDTPAKVLFLASPNSPSGTTHATGLIEELARTKPDTLVVVDEAYADFAGASAIGLVGTVPNVAVLRTFSKSYSLAGMRLGLLFADPAILTQIHKVKDSYNLDRLAIVAGAAALRDQPWMQGNVGKIRATRGRLTESLAAMGYDVLPSSANFVFARARSADFARRAYRFLKDRGILIRYFDRPLLDDGLRITVGTDAEIDALLEALQAFAP